MQMVEKVLNIKLVKNLELVKLLIYAHHAFHMRRKEITLDES